MSETPPYLPQSPVPLRPRKEHIDYTLDALVNIGVIAFITRFVLRGGKRS